jgi:mono/diheme cytochrome c family protein
MRIARFSVLFKGLVAVGLAAIFATPSAAQNAPVSQASPSDQVDDPLIRQGQYLATAGDCIACHTAPGGKPFAGGLLMPTPVGNIVSTNITPSKTHGIGSYTLKDFTRAMREGKGPGGKHLYPAMPYPSYALVTDDDIMAMYAYFMRSVEPVDTAPAETELPFPFNLRASMSVWNMLFLDAGTYQGDPEKGELWNRGAYLARGLTHCSACHTPRNTLMAEKRSSELAGADIGTWYAPNITPDPISGIGEWTREEVVAYMRTGRVEGKAQAAGPMAEAIDHSLQHLTDDDLNAIAVYLETVPAERLPGEEKAAHAWGAPYQELASLRGKPLPQDLDQMTGAQLYDAECASCHHAQGEGSRGLPSLFHNSAVGRLNTNNLVMAILDGVTRGHGDNPGTIMPAYRHTLSDTQIATLGTYMVQHFGNPESAVTVEQVAQLRSGEAMGPNLVMMVRIAIAAGVLIVLLLIAAFIVKRRQ